MDTYGIYKSRYCNTVSFVVYIVLTNVSADLLTVGLSATTNNSLIATDFYANGLKTSLTNSVMVQTFKIL